MPGHFGDRRNIGYTQQGIGRRLHPDHSGIGLNSGANVVQRGRIDGCGLDTEAGQGQPFYYFANGAAASEVVVDARTGEYRVARVDILHDVGDSLNPAIDIGQIEGGFIQGMGWLTTEDLRWDETGRLISNSPANYKIPTAFDTPAVFNVDLYDEPNREDTIYRSKAVGEPPLMLGLSVWCALRDACASVADYAVNPPLNAPATSEEVFRCLTAARAYAGDAS